MSVRNYTLRNDLRDLVIEDSLINSPLLANALAPTIDVTTVEASFNVLPTGETLRTGDTRRNTDGTFNKGTHKYDKGSYATEEFGWEESSDNVQRLTNLEFFDDQLITSLICNSVVLICREKRVADAFQKTSAYPAANQETAGELWTDKSAASPRTDINNCSLKAWQAFGLKKRNLEFIMTEDNLEAAMLCDETRKDASFTINLDEYTFEAAANYLARIWGIWKVTIVSSTFNAAGLGGAFEATEMWSNDGCILRLPPNGVQSWKLPAFARQPVYTPFAKDRRFESNDNFDNDSTSVRVREYRGLTMNYKYGIILNGTLS